MGIIGQAVGTGVVLGLLASVLKKDFRLLQYGSISAILVCLFTAYATSTKLLMFAAIFVLIGAPSKSANGSIVSRLVSPSKKDMRLQRHQIPIRSARKQISKTSCTNVPPQMDLLIQCCIK
eukprot:XP_011672338.1 PREDICTED: uncharacterized protein LOC754028 isoform X2 [Strongylocentrotus purpuratus]